jgi:hypothetical protein
MQLWTWHMPDFSLLDGRVEHDRSKYVQMVAGVREAWLSGLVEGDGVYGLRGKLL